MDSKHRHHSSLLFRGMSAQAGIVALVLAFPLWTNAQTPGPPPRHSARQAAPEVHAIREDELRQQLQGKTFYLRGGYVDNELHFNEQGRLAGNSPQESYTLSMVQIDKVHLSKHKVEFAGIRYGLHFLGANPTEDPLAASDKVRITPRKKVLKITLDRAEVTTPKKKSKSSKGDADRSARGAAAAQQPLDPNRSLAESAANGESEPAMNPEQENLMTQARANQLLREALDRIFSPGLDERMIASLPDFWRFYYQAAAAKTDYRPNNPAVLRQNTVDQKARLLTNFQPPSNDFAQAAGVAGVALYHVVVSTDGMPAEIAVGRPIGFGLDENAVASIRKATFQPAMKDGKPVPVLLDLVVQFRIYSKRTGQAGNAVTGPAVSESDSSPLPGPYTANQPATKQP